MEDIKISPPLRLYGMRFKDFEVQKDRYFYDTIADTMGYCSLKLSIAARNFLRTVKSEFKI